MKRVSSLLALAAAMGWSQGLLQAQAQAPAADAAVETAEEIVVTVQKREQKVLEVPIAVTAYDQDFLDRIGVQKFDELSLFVPGLEIQEQSPNNPGFVIRGITSDSGEATIEPRVAVFQDGVSISRSRGSYVELFDLERVEIAKGPQATLFGRGALIGGINIIQNKADMDTLGGNAEATLGDFGQFSARAVFNAPIITDKLAVRFAAATRQRDGFTTNFAGGPPLGGVSLDAGRLAIAWRPIQDLRLDLIANRQQDNNSGTSFKSGTFAPTGGNVSPFSPAALNSLDPNVPLGLKRDVNSVTLLGAWDISDALTLSSTTGYRNFQSVENFDPDGSALPLFNFVEDAKGDQWSQELRLNFEASPRLSGFVGASYTFETGRQRVPLAFDERVVLGLFSGAITRPAPQPTALLTNTAFTTALVQGNAAAFGMTLTTAQAAAIAANLKPNHREVFTNSGETESIDLYGDLTFKLTDKLELTGGLRWTRDDKTSGYAAQTLNGRSILGGFLGALGQSGATRTALLTALQAPGAANIPTSPGFPVPNFGLFAQPTATAEGAKASESFDDITWRAVARYAVSDEISVWGSFARGRRPEVLNGAGPAAPSGAVSFTTLPAEIVDSVEAGAKGRFLGGRLGLEGSIFYYEYQDFQTTEFVGPRIVTINAGEATSTGFEGAVDYRPVDMLQLFANYAYNDAQLETGARKGNRFRLSPEHSFALGGTLSVALPAELKLVFTPTYTWQSEIFFDDDNDKPNLQNQRLSPFFNDTRLDEKQDSYGLINLRLNVVGPEERWSAGLYVTNLADEEYIIDAGNTGDSFGIPTFIRGTPRLVGLEVKGRF